MRIATNSDKSLVSNILTSAFESLDQENSINYVVKQDNKRIERMNVLMEYLFDRSMLFGNIFISDNEKACLLIKYPRRERLTLKTLRLDIRLAVKCIGLSRVGGILKRQRVVKKFAPIEEHITPVILGVVEKHQGRGTAVRLMLEVKKAFADNQLPVIIDAAAMANVEMYQKFGFKVFGKDDSLGFPLHFLRLN